MPLESKQLRYYRLRQAHPDMTPADAMDIASQEPEAEPTSPLLAAIQGAQVKPPEPAPEVPAVGGMPPEELHQLDEPAAPPMVQAQPPAVDEMAAFNAAEQKARDDAEETDRTGKRNNGIARGIRHLIAGITNTTAVEEPKYEAELPGVASDFDRRRAALRDSLMRKRQGELDTSTLDLQRSQTERNRADASKSLRDPAPKPVDPTMQSMHEATIEKTKAETDALNRKPEEDAKRLAAHLAEVSAKRKGGGVPAAKVVAGQFDSIPDAGERATVKAIVEGRAPAPAPGSRSGQRIMSLVAQVAPDFDSTKYGAYQHARTEQGTNASINAAKAVTHHMDLLRDAVGRLPDGMLDSPGANRLAQGFADATGDDKYTEMKNTAAIVAAELAQALGEKDVEGRAMVARLVDPAQTKAQWAKSIPALEQLRDEKLGTYRETLQNLGPTKSGPDPVAPVEASKSVGGKTYVKRNGAWHEVQ